MWRPWDTDSKQDEEHQYNDSGSSDAIPVLESDRESVIFVVEKPSPCIHGPCIIVRAIQALPPF